MGRRARGLSIFAAVVAVVVSLASCRSATEVVVDVRTNTAYHDGLVVSFTVGTPDEVESGAPTTEARTPWGADGFVGSLTVVPSSGSSKDTSLGVKVVLGVDRDSRSCAPPAYEGCIVARRRIHYAPHERLELPIALYVQCKDVACDATSTCNLLGQCVSATVDPATCSSARGCSVAGDPQASTPPRPGDERDVDAAGDGATTDGAADAAAAGDGAMDAPSDAPRDGASEAGTAGFVDCGPGLTCDATAGNACCFDPAAGAGTCVANGGSCATDTGKIDVTCDGNEDCTGGTICCAVGPTMQCAPGCGPYAQVCHSTKECTGGVGGVCAARTYSGGYYETCK